MKRDKLFLNSPSKLNMFKLRLTFNFYISDDHFFQKSTHIIVDPNLLQKRIILTVFQIGPYVKLSCGNGHLAFPTDKKKMHHPMIILAYFGFNQVCFWDIYFFIQTYVKTCPVVVAILDFWLPKNTNFVQHVRKLVTM